LVNVIVSQAFLAVFPIMLNSTPKVTIWVESFTGFSMNIRIGSFADDGWGKRQARANTVGLAINITGCDIVGPA